eukprot:1159417-Pelagomonas_calceolata.AAC.4
MLDKILPMESWHTKASHSGGTQAGPADPGGGVCGWGISTPGPFPVLPVPEHKNPRCLAVSSVAALQYHNMIFVDQPVGTGFSYSEVSACACVCVYVYHNMIFVDQPVGTGFSYSEDDRDRVYGEDGVANDMLDFVYEFLESEWELAGVC